MMKRLDCGIALGLALALLAPVALAQDTGVIKGTVKFEGGAPKMKKIRMDAESTCKAHHDKRPEPPRDEAVVVNKNATLANVVVYVAAGLPAGKTFPVPAEPVTLDQKGCQYQPHVWGMMAGQALRILNSDEGVLHNVHSFSEKGNGFNKGMPGVPGVKLDQVMPDEEKPVKIRCDVHGWMNSYAMVLPHPFHSVTSAEGAFEIKGLPAGDYTVEAWHEKYSVQSQTVKVGAGESKELTFTYKSELPAEAGGAAPEATPSRGQ